MLKQYTIRSLFVLIFSLSFGIITALNRLVARDEGFYAYAADLVGKGYFPYFDYFYPQMPLLPYIYGIAGVIGGIDWIGLRVFSGIIFGLILFVTYLIIEKKASKNWGIFGLLLLATCHLSFAWFPVVQTYGLSVLFLLLILYILICDEFSKGRAILVGVFLGLSICTRLFFAPVIVVPLLYFLTGERRAYLRSFLVGTIIGLAPALIHFCISPEIFWFNNLGYHLSRSSRPFEAEMRHKWRIFEVLFSLGRPSEKFSGFQTPILFLGMFLAPFISLFRSKAILLSSGLGIVIFIVSFLPTPPYVQYFVTVVPFAVISFVYALHLLSEKISTKSIRGVSTALLAGVLLLYLYHYSYDYERYTKTGEGVIGVGSLQGASEWNLDRLGEIREVVLRYSKEGDTILSLWPGYLVGVNRLQLPGTENHFGLRAGEKLPRDKRIRYQVKSIDDLVEVINAEAVTLVVGYRRSFRGKIRQALKKQEYVKIDINGLVEVWRIK